MLHVTDRAKEALLRSKRAHVRESGMGLRLTSRRDGRLGLVADRAKAGDQVVRHEEEMVLLVDAELSELIFAGKTVDCRQTTDGSVELILRSSGHVVRDQGPRPSR